MNSRSDIELETRARAATRSAPATRSGELERRVFAARVRLLYSGTGLIAGVTLINAVILAAVIRNVAGNGFVLGGSAVGAVPTLTRHLPAYLAFMFPTLVPVVIHFARMGGEPGVAWPS